MNPLSGALRSLSRRLARTLIISSVLGLSIAVLVATVAGVQASQDNTQGLVDNVKNSTATLVADVDAATAELVANVDSNIEGLVERIEARTAESVAAITKATDEMVAQVEAGANQTINIAQMSETQINVGSGRGGAVSDSDIAYISTLSNIEAVIPTYSFRMGGTGDPRAQDWDYILQGVPLDNALLDDYFLLPSSIVEGRALRETDTSGVMISIGLLEFFDYPEIGDTIYLKDIPFTLVGTFYSQSPMEEKAVFLDWKIARDFGVRYGSSETTPSGPGGGFQIQIGQSLSLSVYVDSVDNLNTVAAAIEDYNSTLSVRTPSDTQGGFQGGFNENIVITQEQQITMIKQQAAQQISTIQANADAQITEMQTSVADQKAQTTADAEAQKAQAQSAADAQVTALVADQQKIESMGILISIIAAVAGILIIFGIMFYTLRERTREIGVYKALGFSNLQATFKFMFEGTFIGLFGGVIGILLALFSYSLLVDTMFHIENAGLLPVAYLLIGLVLAVAVATLGSLYPAWQASRISPLVALKNDK